MDQKKDKDTQHEMLRTACGRPSRPLPSSAASASTSPSSSASACFSGAWWIPTCLEAVPSASSRASSSASRVHSTRCSGSSSKTGLSESFCSLTRRNHATFLFDEKKLAISSTIAYNSHCDKSIRNNTNDLSQYKSLLWITFAMIVKIDVFTVWISGIAGIPWQMSN